MYTILNVERDDNTRVTQYNKMLLHARSAGYYIIDFVAC